MLCFSPNTLGEKKKRSILGRPGSQISSLKRQECVETLHVHSICTTLRSPAPLMSFSLSQKPVSYGTLVAARHLPLGKRTTHFGSWRAAS